MKKIPTLFLRSPDTPSLVLPEINPDAAWLLEESATATVKKDGTNVCVVIGPVEVDPYEDYNVAEAVYKRRNPSRKEKEYAEKEGLPKPEPTYVLANPSDPADQNLFAAVNVTDFSGWPAGAWPCEALGPKIQGGVESDVPALYPFTLSPEIVRPLAGLDYPGPAAIEYEEVKAYLALAEPIEGIVWHGSEGKMAKIKRRDFGLPWPLERSWR